MTLKLDVEDTVYEKLSFEAAKKGMSTSDYVACLVASARSIGKSRILKNC